MKNLDDADEPEQYDPDWPIENVVAFLRRAAGLDITVISDEEWTADEQTRREQRIADLTKAAGFPTLHEAITVANYAAHPDADTEALRRALEWMEGI